ncbi:nitronate monooxygenase [Candidatus Woesearchaeota archaeon]|nr:nitronate monooxygenase [Candidatus Woesearchaeota archaeon]
MSSLERKLELKGVDNPKLPLFLGGMGADISNMELAVAVGIAGGVAVRSSVAMDVITPNSEWFKDEGISVKLDNAGRMGIAEAVELELKYTREKIEGATGEQAAVGINIMCALERDYEESVRGAVNGGANVIISGAGLPLDLPKLVEKYAGKNHNISLVPIVSSARAAKIICNRWESNHHCKPDLIYVEGSKAGGHLGWHYETTQEPDFIEKYDVARLITEVEDWMEKSGNDVPLIAAGGLKSYEGIEKMLKNPNVVAVSVATPLALTQESGFKNEYILQLAKNTVSISDKSPCGYPFVVADDGPLVVAQKNDNDAFPICPGLIATRGMSYDPEKIKCLGYVWPISKGKDCPAFDSENKQCSAITKGNVGVPLITLGYNGEELLKRVAKEGLPTAAQRMEELIG